MLELSACMHELQLRHFRPSAVWKHIIKRTKKNTKEPPGIVSLDGMVKAQGNCLLLFDSTIKITTLKYVLFGLFFPDDYSCNSTMQWNKNWKIFGFCSNGHKINIMLSHFYVLWLDYLLKNKSCEYVGFLISLHLLKMEDIRRVTFRRNELLSDVHVRRSNINGFFYLIYGVKYITLGSSPL